MRKLAKTRRMQAEKAAVWYIHEVLGCQVSRRAIRTQWQKVDFFGADVVGKKPDGSHVYIQVTAGQHSAVSARKRKLEGVPWHESDQVLLLRLVSTEDPANARKLKFFFRIYTYDHSKNRWNISPEAFDVAREWLTKAHKGGESWQQNQKK